MSPATILIIEDDASILFSLRDALELAGYRVCAAVEGNLGLKLALEEAPDLILLDLMLPGLNGLQICQELRRCEKAMPIIMVSALGQEADVIRGLNLGADDYVTKPFSIAQLLARIASFLRRHRSRDAKVIEFAPGLRLNTTARTLARGTVSGIDAKGIRAARIPDPQRRPGADPRSDFECCLGQGFGCF